MNSGKPVFSQLMDWIHPQEFERCVRRYGADYKVKSFSCWDQFLCMAFAQLTYRESLRDIEICLRSRQSQLYHMGFRGHISRNTLSHANEHRPWKVYEDLALRLITKARKLYAQEDFGIELAQTAYAQTELFFKWIKQNLRIKSFYGTSDNAVRTQIWIAVCVYVLVAIIKKQLNLPQSLYQILQILSINAFEKTSLHQLLTKTDCQNPHPTSRNQLSLTI